MCHQTLICKLHAHRLSNLYIPLHIIRKVHAEGTDSHNLSFLAAIAIVDSAEIVQRIAMMVNCNQAGLGLFVQVCNSFNIENSR